MILFFDLGNGVSYAFLWFVDEAHKVVTASSSYM